MVVNEIPNVVMNSQVRHFNFWEAEWPESLENQLNPDVTVRTRGIMEK